jgi:hypothetical protein
VFHGAFAGCLALGREWEETLLYSSAAAAELTRAGSRSRSRRCRGGGLPGLPVRDGRENPDQRVTRRPVLLAWPLTNPVWGSIPILPGIDGSFSLVWFLGSSRSGSCW